MPTHTNRKGTTNDDVARTPGMALDDKSDVVKMSVTGRGSNIWKVMPGLNQSIVPLIPDHNR